MDPLSLIEAALVAGAAAGAQETTNEAIKDAYAGLKNLLKRLIVDKPEFQNALNEQQKAQETSKISIKGMLTEIHAEQDIELLAAAQRVMQVLQQQQVDMAKFTIQNFGTVQGQNIGDNQQITQYFQGSGKGNENIVESPNGLIFASIMLDKENPYWYEIDDLTSEEVGKPFPPNITNALIPDPYHRLYSQHFHATSLSPNPDRIRVQLAQLPEEERGAMEYLHAMGVVKERADPSFDVTLLNPTRQPIILTAIGIELTSVALIYSLPGGGPRAYTVPIDASYAIEIPDIRESLDITKSMQRVGSSYHHVPPVQLNKVYTNRLPDPICIPPRATFRYKLLLDRYLEHIPNSVLLHLWIQTHGGHEKSDGLYLSFGDIWWEKGAIKELGKAAMLED